MSEEKRICRKCAAAKPLEAFGFNRANSDGRSAVCKECNAFNSRQKRIEKKAVAAGFPPRKKKGRREIVVQGGMECLQCKRCRKVKTLSEFYHSAHSPTGYAYNCAECEKLYHKLRSHTSKRDAALSTDKYIDRDRIRLLGERLLGD